MSYTAAFGYADRAARTPDTNQTEYRLGSVSKQFTAMGVLLLAARHRLSVAGRLCRYLPRCPAGWHAITIADLLDHTSGIPDYLNDLDARWPPEPATPGQLIASFAAAPLHFAPGTRMRYSNSGYVLLGALIERITGQPRRLPDRRRPRVRLRVVHRPHQLRAAVPARGPDRRMGQLQRHLPPPARAHHRPGQQRSHSRAGHRHHPRRVDPRLTPGSGAPMAAEAGYELSTGAPGIRPHSAHDPS